MTGESKTKFVEIASALKEFVSALRDCVILIVFIVLIISPDVVKKQFLKAGFTSLEIGSLKLQSKLESSENDTKAAGESIYLANEQISNLSSHLNELEKTVNNKNLKEQFVQAAEKLDKYQSELTTADQKIKQSLATQQQIKSELTSKPQDEVGWIYLGKINDAKNQWAPGYPSTVAPTQAPPKIGSNLTISYYSYLREDGPSNARSTAHIQGVLTSGEIVQVVDIDYSHAREGGWFVWAKVKRPTTN